MKKLLKSTIILVLTICLIFIFVGCNNSANNIKNIQDQISEIQNQINNLQGSASANDIANLQSQLSNLQSQLEALQNSTTPKVYKIGDTIPCIVNGVHMFDIQITDYIAELFITTINGEKVYRVRYSITMQTIQQEYNGDIESNLCYSVDLINKSSSNKDFHLINYGYTKPTDSTIISDTPTFIYLGLNSNNATSQFFTPFAKVTLCTPRIIINDITQN